MKKYLPAPLLILAVFLVALGFNTIDIMINTFYWKPPNYSNGLWSMNTWFKWEFWNCYMFFGILPLTFGCILIGFILGRLPTWFNPEDARRKHPQAP